MPETTFQKFFLIACIVTLGAVVASVARADAPGFSETVPDRVTSLRTALPMCPMGPAMTPIDAAGTGQTRQTPILAGIVDRRYRLGVAQTSRAPLCVNSHIPFNQMVRS